MLIKKFKLSSIHFNKTNLKELRFEPLESPVVCSCLLDQRDTEVQLVQIVQNLINPRDNFAAMFLESLVNMLISLVSDEIWIHERKHMDDLIVRLKDAKIVYIKNCFTKISILFLYYSTKSFTPCASISVLIDFQVVKSSFLKFHQFYTATILAFRYFLTIAFYPGQVAPCSL